MSKSGMKSVSQPFTLLREMGRKVKPYTNTDDPAKMGAIASVKAV